VLAVLVIYHGVFLDANVLPFRWQIVHIYDLVGILATPGMCYTYLMVLNIEHKCVLSDQSSTKHNFVFWLNISSHTVFITLFSV
jgi:hypothetical protein